MKTVKTIFLVFCIFLMTSITYSQEQVNDTIKVVPLEPIVLNGVRSSKLTPISKSLISRDSIQKTYQGYEVSQVINTKPNITSHTDNGTPFGYTYFRIRGIDQTRINMTLNGVPLNEPEDQGVYFSNYPNFMDNIKSLEIQRGVGTSSNGVSSFAGSINFISQDGREEDAFANITIGSFGAYRGSFTYQSGVNENNLSFYANVSTYTTDGYKYNSGGLGSSAFVSGGYYTKERDLYVTMFSGYSENEMAWKPVSIDDINDNPRTNYNSLDGDDKFNQNFIQLSSREKLNDFVSLRTSAFYNYLNGEFDYLSSGDSNLFLNSHFFGAVSNLNYKENNDEINVGVSGNFYQRKHQYTFAETNNGFKNEFSSYVKYIRKLGNLSIHTDVQYRYTNFDYKGDVELDRNVDWNFLNPKFGLSYKFNNYSRLYASVGKSSREPTRTDLFQGADFLIEGTEINDTPEKVIDYELGHVINSNKISLSTNLFYMDFKDEIALSGGITPNGVPLSRAVDDSYRTGAEIDLTYRITKPLSLNYTESYTYSEINNDGETFQPILTPRTVRNISMKYQNDWLLLEVLYKHHSESFINLENSQVTPSFDVFNANVGYYFGKLSVLVNFQNITDQQYFTNGSTIDQNFEPSDRPHYFVNAPLSCFVTTRYNF